MKITFLKGTSFVSKLIKLWTRGSYSHAAIVFSDGISFSCAITGEMKTCFQNVYLDPKYWDTIEIKMSKEQEEIIKKWCETELDCKYDWAGIFLSQFIPLGIQSKTKWFCSEICVAALQQVGMLDGIKPYRVSPNKLSKLIR